MTSEALVAGVSLVSILKAGDWARVHNPAGHYFSTYITNTDQHHTLCSKLSLALVSSQIVGKCQALTYVVMQICSAVRP